MNGYFYKGSNSAIFTFACFLRAPDEKGNRDISKIIFLISQKNISCDPSLEPS